MLEMWKIYLFNYYACSMPRLERDHATDEVVTDCSC